MIMGMGSRGNEGSKTRVRGLRNEKKGNGYRLGSEEAVAMEG